MGLLGGSWKKDEDQSRDTYWSGHADGSTDKEKEIKKRLIDFIKNDPESELSERQKNILISKINRI